MHEALERALDRADCVIETARHRPPKRKCSSRGGKSLHEKLYDIYFEECGREPEVAEELTRNVNLLEKLVTRESLPYLVVNLYAGKEGYSLMLKEENEPYSETIRLPYEERDFLEYLDAEELPPILVDLLEKSQVNIFHSGCVIAEVRDYRQCNGEALPGYQSRHILLRPTMQTLACDVQSISSDDQLWTQEDKLSLESQMILATAEPLCLDPSVSVACAANRLLYNKQKMNTPAMRRNFKRYSTASLNRQQALSSTLPPPELRTWAYHTKNKESQAGAQCDLKIFKAGNCVDTWKQRPCDLQVPSEVDVEKYAKQERPVEYGDSQPTVWPDQEVKYGSLFGWEADDRLQTTKLPFMQSLNDPLISGKRRSPKKVRCRRQVSHCQCSTDDHSNSYMPTSKTAAGKVGSQSVELVQKRTTCPVRVSQGSSGSTNLSHLSPGKEVEQPQVLSILSSVPGKGVQRTHPPISLLSSSGNSSSGNSFTPQQASSFRKSPFPAPASRTPSLPQRSSVEVSCISTLPAATLSTASLLQTTSASQVKATSASPNVIKVVGPVHVAQTVVRGSNPMKVPAARTKVPIAIKPKTLCSGGRLLPNIQPTAPKDPSQGVQLFLNNAPDLRPITLLQLPPGSLILNTQQPQQQPLQQPPQPQQFYQLIPQQHQQPISYMQKPVSKGSSARGSARQRMILPAPQAAAINPSEAGSALQPQMAGLSQPRSTQKRPGQNPHPQGVQLPSAFQQLPQPQQVELRILQHLVTVPTIETQTAQPHHGQQSRQQASQKLK